MVDELVIFISYSVIIGFPMLLAYFVGGVEWSVQIGIFAMVIQILKNQVIHE